MATRTVVHVVCDVCQYRGQPDVPAVWSELVKIGETERLLELCAEHRDEPTTMHQLAEWLRKYGSKVRAEDRPTKGVRRSTKLRAV